MSFLTADRLICTLTVLAGFVTLSMLKRRVLFVYTSLAICSATAMLQLHYGRGYPWAFLREYCVTVGIPVVMAWAGNHLAAEASRTSAEKLLWRFLFACLTALALGGSFWVLKDKDIEHQKEIGKLRGDIKDDMFATILAYNQTHPQHPVTAEQFAELTRSLNTVTASSRTVPTSHEITNEEVCRQATVMAGDIRLFQSKYDLAEREDLFLRRRTIEEQVQADREHESEFTNTYLAKAKYLRDLFVDRLPPKTSDMLRSANGQADGSLSISNLSGAFSESFIASYLDELAAALCPPTALQQKAQLKEYRVMLTKMHAFESQGKKLREQCVSPASTAPPTSIEVDKWVGAATTYVRNSSIDLYIKNDFANLGSIANARYAGACPDIMGKIIGENAKIYGLEMFLEDRLKKKQSTMPPSQ